MSKEKFITIDGVEGAGKSTQIDLICSYLHRKGIEVVRTREPGGTDLGEKFAHYCSMLIIKKCIVIQSYY